MKEFDVVLVKSGEHKGKTGTIVGTMPMRGMAGDEEIATLCVVQFEDGTEDTIVARALEVVLSL